MTSPGDAYPLADGVRFFTRDRWNVGQATNRLRGIQRCVSGKVLAAFVGGSMNIVGSVGCGMNNAYIQLAQRAYREC